MISEVTLLTQVFASLRSLDQGLSRDRRCHLDPNRLGRSYDVEMHLLHCSHSFDCLGGYEV
jgi:hypothetical protein